MRNLAIAIGEHVTEEQVQAMSGLLNYVEVSR